MGTSWTQNKFVLAVRGVISLHIRAWIKVLPSPVLVTPGCPPPPVAQHSALWVEGAWDWWEQESQEAEPLSPIPLPLSVVHGVGFPSTLEDLRAESSHIPSQVGQVAWVFGQGLGVVSSGLILFGFYCFICWPRRVLRLSISLLCQHGLPGFSALREWEIDCLSLKPCHSLLLCFMLLALLKCHLFWNSAVSFLTELKLGLAIIDQEVVSCH